MKARDGRCCRVGVAEAPPWGQDAHPLFTALAAQGREVSSPPVTPGFTGGLTMEMYTVLLSKVMRRLYERGLIDSKGGNASIRVKLGSMDVVLMTPSGAWKPEIDPDEIAALSLDGTVIYGKPSVEHPMHLEIYRRTGATAVVHAHNPLATALAEATLLEANLPETIDTCIAVVPHYPSGSRALAEAVASKMERGCGIVVIESHGVVAAAEGEPRRALIKALDLIEAVEIAAWRVLAKTAAAATLISEQLRWPG